MVIKLLRHALHKLFGPKPPPLLPVGSAAPDFALLDHTGRRVTLADRKGHRSLLWFYPKADTPG